MFELCCCIAKQLRAADGGSLRFMSSMELALIAFHLPQLCQQWAGAYVCCLNYAFVTLASEVLAWCFTLHGFNFFGRTCWICWHRQASDLQDQGLNCA